MTAPSMVTVYGNEADQLAVAREPLYRPATSLCPECGVSGPCARRGTSVAMFSRHMRLPRLVTKNAQSAQPAEVARLNDPVLVGVIGPPGVGKSTVIANLLSRREMPVFRLREAVRAHVQLLADLRPSRDPLGWVSLEAVRRVLQATFVTDEVGRDCSTVLLDNFPGTATQLDLLAEIAMIGSARVALLELYAETSTVISRVALRRVCLACGMDSHAPAVPAADDPQRCRSCRKLLVRRGTDVPYLHGLRLNRYATNRPKIVERAARLCIPHLSINANTDVSEVCRAVHDALHRLTKPIAHSRSRP